MRQRSVCVHVALSSVARRFATQSVLACPQPCRCSPTGATQRKRIAKSGYRVLNASYSQVLPTPNLGLRTRRHS